MDDIDAILEFAPFEGYRYHREHCIQCQSAHLDQPLTLARHCLFGFLQLKAALRDPAITALIGTLKRIPWDPPHNSSTSKSTRSRSAPSKYARTSRTTRSRN